MRDHSLNRTRTRFAEEGEELILHKFETGALCFASVSDLIELENQAASEPDTLWGAVKAWLSPGRSAQPQIITIPSGTRLMLGDVPRTVQNSLYIGPSEVVVFTEISSRKYSYRDALLLPNGTRVLLQDLPEGLHVIVLSTSPEPSAKSAITELNAA